MSDADNRAGVGRYSERIAGSVAAASKLAQMDHTGTFGPAESRISGGQTGTNHYLTVTRHASSSTKLGVRSRIQLYRSCARAPAKNGRTGVLRIAITNDYCAQS
jgi:hypothetical protein